MRKIRFMSVLLTASMAVTMMPSVLSADGEGVELNETNFPDPVFREYLGTNYDYDSNGVLDEEEISAVKVIQFFDGEGIGLTDLTGVKYLTELEILAVRSDTLKTVDISGMPRLYHLDVEHNEITSLNVSGATALSELNCSDNRMTSLDLSGLPNLEYVYCHDVPTLRTITNIASESLEVLWLENTGISQVDISGCPALTYMRIEGTDITSLDMSNNRALFDNISRCEMMITSDHQDFEYYRYIVRDPENANSFYLEFAANRDIQMTGPDGAAVPTPTPPQGVEGFVDRLYSVALGRTPDITGKASWVNVLETGCSTGADVARGFLYSPEFVNRGLSTNDFVTVLYRTFFGREPDQAGLDSWVSAINGGTSREDVIGGFIDSVEWANLCCSFNIESGGAAAPTIDRQPNQATINFATRLYTTCLSREADQEGLMAWAVQLANHRDTGTGAARGFFFSSEFTNQNVSNSEYVTRLYRTFMDREPDQAGFDAWVAQLDSGVSREDVFSGFSRSSEFAQICWEYGIIVE